MVVFGLVKIPLGATIRVLWNLRICDNYWWPDILSGNYLE